MPLNAAGRTQFFLVFLPAHVALHLRSNLVQKRFCHLAIQLFAIAHPINSRESELGKTRIGSSVKLIHRQTYGSCGDDTIYGSYFEKSWT